MLAFFLFSFTTIPKPFQYVIAPMRIPFARRTEGRSHAGQLGVHTTAGQIEADEILRVADHLTRTQREINRSRRIGKMLATITNPFGPSA